MIRTNFENLSKQVLSKITHKMYHSRQLFPCDAIPSLFYPVAD